MLARNRQLWQAVALVGVLIAVVAMFLPVSVAFADDPLLRLQGFGRQAGPAQTTADCGSVLSNLGEPSGGGTLFEVARDRACHDESQRRAGITFAAGLLLVVIGAAGMVGADRGEARLQPAGAPDAAGAREARLQPVGAPEEADGPGEPDDADGPDDGLRP